MALFKTRKGKAVEAAAAQARRNLVAVNLDRGQGEKNRCDVIGSVFFTSEVIKTPIGSVTLELKGGHLHFKPHGGRIPIDSLSTALTPPLNLGGDVGVSSVRGASHEAEAKASGELSGARKRGGDRKLSTEAAAKLAGEKRSKTADNTSETLNYTVAQRGLSASPYDGTGIKISFESPLGVNGTGQPLRGRLFDDRMFSLERQGDEKAGIAVTFQPSPSHVDFRDGTGIWGRELSQEKRQLIRRLLAMLVDEEEWPLGQFELLPESEAKE